MEVCAEEGKVGRGGESRWERVPLEVEIEYARPRTTEPRVDAESGVRDWKLDLAETGNASASNERGTSNLGVPSNLCVPSLGSRLSSLASRLECEAAYATGRVVELQLIRD